VRSRPARRWSSSMATSYWVVDGLSKWLNEKRSQRKHGTSSNIRVVAVQTQSDEFFQSADQRFDLVTFAQIHRQKHALAVIRCDDEVMLAVDRVAHFLGLVAGDEHLSLHLLHECGCTGG